MQSQKNYKKTYAACFTGIMNQAVVTNITAILFVPFMTLYGLKLWQLGILVGINFGAQLLADTILTFIIDKVSFRPLTISAVILSASGLILFAFVPKIFGSGNIFTGIITATIVFAFSSGMLEVLISPIIDNIPGENDGKGAAMSLMHSFYAWGQVLVVLCTTLFLYIFGIEKWHYIVLVWACIPVIALLFFSAAPLDKKENTEKKKKGTFFSPFFLIACLAILMGGASEVIMNQYASAFVQLSLGFSKIVSDIVGLCLFAVCLGIGRLFYGIFGSKINISKVLITGSALACIAYLIAGLVPVKGVSLTACIISGLFVSLLWPGTLVVVSQKFVSSGVWIFAVLAISGDFGAGVIPMLTGFTADATGLKSAIAIASVIPFIACVCHLILYRSLRKDKKAKMLNSNI